MEIEVLSQIEIEPQLMAVCFWAGSVRVRAGFTISNRLYYYIENTTNL